MPFPRDPEEYPPLLKRATRAKYVEKVKQVSSRGSSKKGCPLTILLLLFKFTMIFAIAQVIN